jgi:hypothetical protein
MVNFLKDVVVGAKKAEYHGEREAGIDAQVGNEWLTSLACLNQTCIWTSN